MLGQIISEAPRFFSYYNVLLLAEAVLGTFLLSAAGCIVGLVLGTGLAVLRRTEAATLRPARLLAIFLVEIFRRVPFLVTLMLAFFVFQGLNLDLSLFVVALVAVCLIATAFIAEIVRSGLDSVHRAQWDAAASMNLGYLATIRLIVLPQAWRVILPPAFSYFVLFIKDTALASQIGVLELTYAGKILSNKGFSATLCFGTVLVLYFALSYPLTLLGAWLEARLAAPRHR
jgi:polar amino acid transport system permease protein